MPVAEAILELFTAYWREGTRTKTYPFLRVRLTERTRLDAFPSTVTNVLLPTLRIKPVWDTPFFLIRKISPGLGVFTTLFVLLAHFKMLATADGFPQATRLSRLPVESKDQLTKSAHQGWQPLPQYRENLLQFEPNGCSLYPFCFRACLRAR